MSIHPVMQRLADKLKRTDLPEFVPGDQVRVQVKIKEGDKERLQAFEGLGRGFPCLKARVACFERARL